MWVWSTLFNENSRSFQRSYLHLIGNARRLERAPWDSGHHGTAGISPATAFLTFRLLVFSLTKDS